MKIIQASFFWRNDTPDGIGLTFRTPEFTSDELASMFAGETSRQYMRDSDANLGTALVETYLAQLGALAQEAKRGPLPLPKALIVCLNILWLSSRGLIPQDEFNGTQFITVD